MTSKEIIKHELDYHKENIGDWCEYKITQKQIDELETVYNDLNKLEKIDKPMEIIKKHKLLNYVLKNKKCVAMYHLTDEELNLLKEVFNE